MTTYLKMTTCVEMITYGYLYCMINLSMPGIFKIGMTKRTPEVRLNEANQTDTWRPPTPYKILMAKRVTNPEHKEKQIHAILSINNKRINPNREYFQSSLDEITALFELIDGESWVNPLEERQREEIREITEIREIREKPLNATVKGSRDITKCFTNGQLIRHTIEIDKTWIGVYDSLNNGIMFDTKIYKSLSGFAQTHYSMDKSTRKSSNGWKECECEVNGKWISTYNL
jgi:hypothetical protein